MQDSVRTPCWIILNSDISAMGHQIKFRFASEVGIWGSADSVVVILVEPNPRGVRAPSFQMNSLWNELLELLS